MPGPKGLTIFQRGEVWYVRGTVRGQTVYESCGTAERKQAEAHRALREAELWQSSVFGSKASVTFTRAVESFVKAKNPSEADRGHLLRLVKHFKGTQGRQIDQEALDRAYAILLPADASDANKTRTVLSPLRAVLNHAARRGWCDVPKFETPARTPPRVAYLTPPQAIAQAAACSAHFRPLYQFLLFTGGRASEALELDWADVDLWGARAVFRDTKNGRQRQVDLVPAAIAVLTALTPQDQRAGPVFLTCPILNRRGQVVISPHPYQNNGRTAGGQFKTAWAGMARRSGVTGFKPHDLRHTWATWHYCLHKDLLRLRNEGGWQSITQVEIYAHLIPDAYRPQIESLLAGRPIIQDSRKEA